MSLHGQPGSGAPGFQISSGDHAPARLTTVVNGQLERSPFGTQITAIGDQPLQGLVQTFSLPGLSFMWARHTPIVTTRKGPVLAEGSDSLLFGIVDTDRSSTHFGREYSLKAGEGVVIGNAQAGMTVNPSPCRQITVIVPQQAIRPLLREKNVHFVQSVAPDCEAMRLLVGYLDTLRDCSIPAGLGQSVVTHVYDLLAAIAGARADALEIARNRGIRIARLRAIKADIEQGLCTDISVGELAARHRLTPRYVQRLFELEGITFSEFLRNQRLERARKMLASPRYDHKQISEIAFAVGFGDISYFDRVFRRRFGIAPRDVRRHTKT